jgi:hypothetical protein
MPGAGTVAAWDLTGQTGDQASTASTSTLPGVTTLPLTRSVALVPSPGTDSMSASNWPTSSTRDLGSYYTLSVTPPTGCTLSLTSVNFDILASSFGPISAGLGTSPDGFAHETPLSTSTPGMVSLSVSAVTATVELRVYGYGATDATGTMRIQHQLTITGSVQ